MTTATTPFLMDGITPIPGVYPGAAMADYHRWSAASNSRLTRLLRSPAHLKAYMEEPPKDTTALRVGRAVHTAILEPDEFAMSFAVAEQCVATKKGDGLQCTNPGVMFRADAGGWLCGVHGKGMTTDETRLVLPATDYARSLAVRDSVHRHTAAAALLAARTNVECSLLWQDAVTQVACKARMDCHSPALVGGTIVDIKTTVDASKAAFERTIFTMGYHRQAAFYLDGARARGLPAEHFVFVAVEKEPPYAVATYRLFESALDAAREQIALLLPLYARCVERDEWPAYSDLIQDIALPDFAWRQITEMALDMEEAA